MTRQFRPQVSFNSGEVSPLLYGRTDYQRVRTGVRKMKGFIPLRQGGFTRAPGTIFRGYTKGNAKARLIPFEFNVSDSLTLELTDGVMRVWRYGALVQDGGSDYELSIPYTEAQLAEIDAVQSSDVIYLADGVSPLRKLSRYALDDWTIADWDLVSGPFRVQNLDDTITVQCSAAEGAITLTGVGGPFSPEMVGSLMMITPVDISEIPVWSGNTKADIGKYFRYDGNIYQLWGGKEDGDGSYYTYDDLPEDPLSGDPVDVSVKTGVSAPIHTEGVEVYDWDSRATWKYISDLYGIFRITSVTDANTASAEVLRTIPSPCISDPSYRWSEGAWNDKYGYPKAIEIVKQRFVAAGTPTDPRTIWFSTIGDYNDHFPTTDADGAFAYNIDGSEGQNGILWLRRSRKGVYIGTLGEVLRGFSSQTGQAIGPTTFDTDVEGVNGTIRHRPITPAGFPVYITKDTTRLEELRYSFEVDGGSPIDLTTPADHIGAEGFAQVVWQSAPLGTIWLRRDDGDLVCLIYDQSEEVLGWSEVPVAGGVVEEISVGVSEDGKRNVLTMVVRREINGETVRMIEEQSLTYGALPGDEPIHEANHLFASKVFDLEVATDTFEVPHLIGEDVYVWTNGGQYGPITVSASGEVQIEAEVTYAVIGLFDDTHHVEMFSPQAEEREGDPRGMGSSIGSNGGVVLHRTAAGYVRGVEYHFGADPVVHDAQFLFDVGVGADLTTAYSGLTNIPGYTGMCDEPCLRFEPYGGAPMSVLAVISPVETGGA
jgi:hypothetical protein